MAILSSFSTLTNCPNYGVHYTPQIAIKYGNTIIWNEYSYFGCFNRFEPIAILLQQKYGAKLKDLIPTRSSEINLYGDQRNAEGIVNEVQGNIWMGRYILNSEVAASQLAKDNSSKSDSANAELFTTAPPNSSKPLKETQLGYIVYLEDDFWFWDDPELLMSGKVIYETYEEALKECQRVINDFLIESYKPAMTADELYNNYLKFGDEPYIRPGEKNNQFSASEYAKERCAEICG